MKTINIICLLVILYLSSSIGLAQEKIDFKNYCDKQWKLISTEEFGVESAPEDNMKKDEALFSTDGKAKIRMFGKQIEGKWALDKTQTYLTITDNKNQKTLLKIYTSSNPENLTLEYKDPDYVKTKMVYESR
jgi:hypothetical protein